MSDKQQMGQFSFRDYLNQLSAKGTEVFVRCALAAEGGSPLIPKGKITVVGEDYIELHPSEKMVFAIPISAIIRIEIYKEA